MTSSLQGPTNTYQEADRLQQLQQQQQQLQQQRIVDVEVVRGGVASPPQSATALPEPVAGPAASPSSQDLTGPASLLPATCTPFQNSAVACDVLYCVAMC